MINKVTNKKIWLFVVLIATTAASSTALAQRGSLNLSGSGDYATAPDDVSLDIAGTSLTLEAWVKHDGESDEDAIIMTKGISTGNGYQLLLRGKGDETYVQFAIGDLNSTLLVSNSGVPANRWTHIAATYDGQFMKIYLNGQQDANRESARDINSNDYNFYLGTNASADGQFYSGELDEVRVWNITRSAAEIADSYMEELSGTEAGLVSYYQFTANSEDNSGSNDLSLVSNAAIMAPGAVPIPPDVYAENSNGQVELSWDQRLDSGSDNIAAEFKVYRSTVEDGSDRQEVATIDGGSTTYTDTDVENGLSYFYEVTSINESGVESDFSAAIIASPYSINGGGSLKLTKDAYGVLSDRPSLDIQDESLTIQAWVKHDGQSDEDAVIVAKGTTGSGYLFRFDGEGQAPNLAFAIGDLNSSILVSNSSVPAHQWTHIAVTYDGESQKIYVNGELDATTAQSRSINANDFSLHIGTDPEVAGKFYSGHLDEISIWSRDLTRQEISNLYNQRLVGNEEGLELYLPFDDISNSIARSMDTYHTDVQLLEINGNAQISAPGIFPVAPYSYAVGVDSSTAEVTYVDREKTEPAQHKLYRSTAQDRSDRTELATLAQELDVYTDTTTSDSSTYYYEVTAVNAEGQESDYSRFSVVRSSELKAGNALLLDGDNDYVILDDRNSLDGYKQLYSSFDNSLTLEAWIKHSGNSDEDAIILTKGTTGAGYVLRLNGSGEEPKIAFAIGDLNSSILLSTSTVPANVWTHVAATYDENDMKIFINGELDASTSQSRNVGDNTHPLVIGSPSAFNGSFYSGEIDEIRIWNSARSNIEIKENYTQKLMGSHEDLIAYFRFAESSDSDVTFSSATRAMSGQLFGDATLVQSNALSDSVGTSIDDEHLADDTQLPNSFRLENNYPNPFNPTTNIDYALPQAAKVTLTIYNVVGQKVATLVNQQQAAGTYQVQFNAENLSSGIYLYNLKAGNFEQIQKMTLIK